MGALALFNHLINLFAPALWLALLMPLFSHLLMRRRPVSHTFIRQIAIHFAVCAVVVVAGLLFFGRDGKMMTYLAMVVSAGSCQWWLQLRKKS